MEPLDLAKIEEETDERLVIKILFDHWIERVDTLKDFISSTKNGGLTAAIAIVRDPRDEVISRLHYAAYNYFASHPTNEQDRLDWLEIFYQKETAPDSIGLLGMEKQLIARFGVGFHVGKRVYNSYLQFIDNITNCKAPPTYVLHYEDFINNSIPDSHLRTILSGSRNVGPWLRRVHRSGSSGDWQHFLLNEDVTTINELCEPFLRRFGYPLEAQPNGKRPTATTGSAYVDGLIKEARRLYEERQQSA